jgi:hypothetical protein
MLCSVSDFIYDVLFLKTLIKYLVTFRDYNGSKLNSLYILYFRRGSSCKSLRCGRDETHRRMEGRDIPISLNFMPFIKRTHNKSIKKLANSTFNIRYCKRFT